MIFPLFHHLFLCQSKTCIAHPKSIMWFILTLRLHQLSDRFTRGTECVRIWTFSLTVCSPNQISLFRPAMRSLLKTANNNTCSTESQDASVKLNLWCNTSLIRHICSYFRNDAFQFSPTFGRYAIKSPLPLLSPLALLCRERRL